MNPAYLTAPGTRDLLEVSASLALKRAETWPARLFCSTAV